MPENYFGERIAETYEAKWPELYEPAAIDPAVSFLAELAGAGAGAGPEPGPEPGRVPPSRDPPSNSALAPAASRCH